MNSLLIEIGTEELPPKSLQRLQDAFAANIKNLLAQNNVPIGEIEAYATPRRLALCIKNAAKKQKDKIDEKRGPSIEHAFDDDHKPTKAALGFARSCGVDIGELSTIKQPEGEWLYYSQERRGVALNEILPEIISDALKKLPIAKKMRWGDSTHEFVRPVKWLVILHGKKVIQTEIMGINSDNMTRGHRFHGQQNIQIASAEDYEEDLEKKGHVIPSFNKRKEKILREITKINENLNGKVEINANLLNEVVGLVEWPTVIRGNFDNHFLSLPEEVLISSMQKHQKYFPVRSEKGELTNNFVTICNIKSKNPSVVRKGNERVIRPRLADAEFFFQTDTITPLENYQKDLGRMIFEKRLGTLLDKTERVTVITAEISDLCNAKRADSKRTVQLARCDLLSEMVREFPDLQGVMGGYYAEKDGENQEVCQAIKEFYHPRFSGDTIPSTTTGRCATLADKIDSIVGLFGIGLAPTGDKDFYALRRAAVGVFRIIIESNIEIDLKRLIITATKQFKKISFSEGVVNEILSFIDDRMRSYYTDSDLPTDAFNSVPNLERITPLEKNRRVKAVQEYRKLVQASSLSAANKRISNILKKTNQISSSPWNENLLIEDSEKQLAKKIKQVTPELDSLFGEKKYVEYMKKLAELSDDVDNFFDGVMVICDEKEIQKNRVSLLHDLQSLFGRIADIGQIKI